MAKTPISGSSAYADYEDLFLRYDPRPVGDWISHNGTRVGKINAAGDVNEATLGASTAITTALMSASGYLESVAFRGAKYSTADLSALTGNTAELLKDIVCGVAIQKLAAHRLNENPSAMTRVQEAMGWMAQLDSGERIFATQESADAGLMDHDRQDTNDVLENWGVAVQYDRYFGMTPDRNPNPYGYE